MFAEENTDRRIAAKNVRAASKGRGSIIEKCEVERLLHQDCFSKWKEIEMGGNGRNVPRDEALFLSKVVFCRERFIRCIFNET